MIEPPTSLSCLICHVAFVGRADADIRASAQEDGWTRIGLAFYCPQHAADARKLLTYRPPQGKKRKKK